MVSMNVMDNRGSCLNARIRRRKMSKRWTIYCNEKMALVCISDKDLLLIVYLLQNNSFANAAISYLILLNSYYHA